MITPACDKFDWQFETLEDPKLSEMLTAAMQFASAIQLNEDPRWLTFLGSSGCGKSLLGSRILEFWRCRAGWRIVHGKGGDFQALGLSRFLSWTRFIERQRNQEWGEMEMVRGTPFLVIDDIGAEHDPSGFAKARLYEVMEARLGKWTVFTSNFLLPQLAEIDTRIASRLIRGGSVIVQAANVKDYNLRKKQQ